MAALRERESMAALALELCILTATRTSEALNAEFSEFDLEKRLWTIPAARMKAARGASYSACRARGRDCRRTGRGLQICLSGPARWSAALQPRHECNCARMGRASITTHGFRSSFRDFAGETTSFPREVIEHALAHRIPDKAEAAYARGTCSKSAASSWRRGLPTASRAGVKPLTTLLREGGSRRRRLCWRLAIMLDPGRRRLIIGCLAP